MDKVIREKVEEWGKSKAISCQSVSGGCIAQATKIVFESGQICFLKTMQQSSSESLDIFQKEAHGLEELAKAKAIYVPKVYLAEKDFLLLEWVENKPSRQTDSFWEIFGQQFSHLHRFQGESFGFFENNYLGSSRQENCASGSALKNWCDFYHQHRLLFQIKLAEKNGYGKKELLSTFACLEKKLPEILSGSEEPPSLLHGDLWGGNYLVSEVGKPVLIDPAVYYGHREADLAMTHLFGGFGERFYQSYEESYPLSLGHEERLNIYKLYHILNHLNLFGMGYYSQALRLMKYYL